MANDDESVASSAVEFDGMDMNEEVAAVEEEEEEETILPDDTNNNTEDDLANQDDLEMEETRKERMELMAAETKSTVLPDDAQGRFEYLMQQSEVFAHFLAGACLLVICFLEAHPVLTLCFYCNRICRSYGCEKE
jgi:hypothetical protein